MLLTDIELGRDSRVVLQQELRRLTAEGGGILTREGVVDAARSPYSPLHSHFDWDDSIAGHRWRLQQAGQLIRVLKTTVVYEKTRHSVPVYVHTVISRTTAGYQELITVQSDEDRLKLALTEINMAMAHLQRATAIVVALRGKGLSGSFSLHLARIRKYLKTLTRVIG